MSVDPSVVLQPGPWEHRFVAANGARFHVTECGQGPLVLFVHGFPQFWWTWRHQLVRFADAGFRAVAMDLRGYGASDKPPQGYDAPTLAADIASVVRCLGESRAIVIGHGLGGWLTWSLPTLHPAQTRAIAVLSAAHPLTATAPPWRSVRQVLAHRQVLALQRRHMTEHKLAQRPGHVAALLRGLAGGESDWPTDQASATYAAGLAQPFCAHSALESYRWLRRSPFTLDGRRYLRRLRQPIRVPVLQIHGAADTAQLPVIAARSARYVTGPYQWTTVPRAGHFPQEEADEAVTHNLITWAVGLGSGS